MPRPIPAVAATPLVSPTPAGSRRGCRSSSAALAALSAAPVARPWIAARDEQPGRRVGEDEQDRRRHQPAERDEQHRPAADVVGDAADEQQAGQHAEGVGRVDQGQRQRREVPQHAVGVVERRRRDRGEQAEADHARGERVGDPVRQRASSLAGGGTAWSGGRAGDIGLERSTADMALLR